MLAENGEYVIPVETPGKAEDALVLYIRKNGASNVQSTNVRGIDKVF